MSDRGYAHERLDAGRGPHVGGLMAGKTFIESLLLPDCYGRSGKPTATGGAEYLVTQEQVGPLNAACQEARLY